jgi:MYXO-CTERM domain-containing protein
MRHRVWLAAFAATPLLLAQEGSARADGAHWSEGLVNDRGERMVFLDNCSTLGLLPGEKRCFSSRLVPESFANEHLRRVQELTARRRNNPQATSCMKSSGSTPVMTPPIGFRPQDLQAAYGLSAAGLPSGAGSIVAIVDACADSTVIADLKTYRSQYNLGDLPECGGKDGVLPTKGGSACIGVVSQTGTASLPGHDSGWATEIALDVDMVSAACPSCSILLVEADSSQFSDLGAAVNFAAAHADSVSNSYGSTESGMDSTTDYTHDGVLIAAASGDSDYYNEIQVTKPTASDPSTWSISYNPMGANSPASMPMVLSVGGTAPTNDSTSPTGFTDHVWSYKITGTKYPNLTGKYLYGGGSGCSGEFATPDFQSVLSGMTGSCSMRASVDVSAAADYTAPPAADGGASGGGGILVYEGETGWEQVIGTSAASPFVTALLTRIGYAAKPISAIYAQSATFHDVTTGNNDPSGQCSDVNCTAGPGWDGPTGWGTPNAAAMLGLDAGAPPMPDAGGPSDAGGGADAGGPSDAGGGPDGTVQDAGGGGGHDSGLPPPHDAGGGYDAGGGADSGGSSGGSHHDSGGVTVPDADLGDDDAGPPTGDTPSNTGCGCAVPGTSPAAPMSVGLLAMAGLAALVGRRRRH